MSGRDLARSILGGEPAAFETFFRLYGRFLEKAVTGLQSGDLGNVLPLPLFSRRVAAIAARLVVAKDAAPGDPFPEAIAALRLGDLYIASAAAFGASDAIALAAERRRGLPLPLDALSVDLSAFDGRSPLLVFVAVAAAATAAATPGDGCPSLASLAAHAAAGPLDEGSASVAAHAGACERCRAIVRRALDAAARADDPGPAVTAPARTLPPPRTKRSTPLAIVVAVVAMLAALGFVLFLLLRRG